jgi:FdhD protein
VARKSSGVNLTQVVEWADGRVQRTEDSLAAEEPLEIRIGDSPLTVTMRTPGHDLELAAGFLFTEGIIQRNDQILSLASVSDATKSHEDNLVTVKLAPDVVPDAESLRRNFFAASSCGVCGKASIESVRSRKLCAPSPDFCVAARTLLSLPKALRSGQDVFARTGGLHAAALFDARGNLQALREDIGRHNAVDKVIGWALREDRAPLSDSLLLVSARGGFEIVQKAIVAGLPVVASLSAPSGLAVRLAREMRLTLVGFLRERRFVIYSGEERIENL